MFHKCNLVHGDLSEYNMLYHQGKLIFIDVSQSVEHEHPNALEFLRMDCKNVNDFFRRSGVDALDTKTLFDFVTNPSVQDDGVDAYLTLLQERHQTRREERLQCSEGEEAAWQVEENVFMSSYIPRSLMELANFEHDSAQFKKAGGGNLEAAMVDAMSNLLATDDNNGEEEEEEEEEEGEGGEEEVKSGEEGDEANTTALDDDFEGDEHETKIHERRIAASRMPGHEIPEERKRWKANKDAAKLKQKEERRESRKTKVKKHIKKRAKKLSSGHSK
jgi:RIO kinase 1